MPRKDGENAADLPEDLAPDRGVASFDQQGQPMEGPGGLVQPGDQAGAIPGAGIPGAVVDQWLDRIEADPAQLLRVQFMIEERKLNRALGGRLTESRPW